MRSARRRLGQAWLALHTIRARLTLWYVALLALILTGFSTFLLLSLSHNLHAELDRSLEVDARQVSAALDSREGRFQLDDEVPPGALVALYDPTGQRLLASNARTPLPDLPAARAQAAQGQQVFATVRLPSGEWRLLTLPVIEDGAQHGVLAIARPEQEIDAALGQLLVLMAIAIPLMLLIAVMGGLFLARRALDPIDRITRTAQSIEAEDLSRRLDMAHSPDEVGRLAATFNQMLDRLERAFRRQQQFTADASHELRTPLALLTSQADLALERPRRPAEYRQVLSSIREDAARLGQLVSELLTLARADAGQEPEPREPLALDLLVDDVVETMIPLAETRGVHLEYDRREPGEVMVAGHQTRLTQLVVNLIDNALKYTPAGGTVTVAVGRDEHQATLRVADTGIGIAPEHLPHLFERFYRVDPARARTDEGTGLGLALAAWIVEAHGGEITVASQPGHGAVFTVRLPLLAERSRTRGPSYSATARQPISTYQRPPGRHAG